MTIAVMRKSLYLFSRTWYFCKESVPISRSMVQDTWTAKSVDWGIFGRWTTRYENCESAYHALRRINNSKRDHFYVSYMTFRHSPKTGSTENEIALWVEADKPTREKMIVFRKLVAMLGHRADLDISTMDIVVYRSLFQTPGDTPDENIHIEIDE